jgi:ATP-dependent DNA helicase PIF1
MTIESLEVDLSDTFEYGQAYVALSRVTSLKGLRVRGFNRDRVMAHDDVKNFYATL